MDDCTSRRAPEKCTLIPVSDGCLVGERYSKLVYGLSSHPRKNCTLTSVLIYLIVLFRACVIDGGFLDEFV